MSNAQVLKVSLVLALFVSSLLLVYSTHLSREKFNHLETLKRAESNLLMRWRRLILEEGALSSLARVEYMASQKIGMRVPHVSEIQVITP